MNAGFCSKEVKFNFKLAPYLNFFPKPCLRQKKILLILFCFCFSSDYLVQLLAWLAWFSYFRSVSLFQPKDFSLKV